MNGRLALRPTVPVAVEAAGLVAPLRVASVEMVARMAVAAAAAAT